MNLSYHIQMMLQRNCPFKPDKLPKEFIHVSLQFIFFRRIIQIFCFWFKLNIGTEEKKFGLYDNGISCGPWCELQRRV